MITRQTSTPKKSDNKAIYEILLKILDKWSADLQSSEDTSHVDSPQITAEDKKEGVDFSDETIVTETVLLRSEDFQTDSPVKTVPEYSDAGPQIPGEALHSETIEHAEDDIPKTVIQDLEPLRAEEPSYSESRGMEIPETVIFSTQKITGSSLPPDGATSKKYESDRQKQASLKSVKKLEDKNESTDKVDINDTIPETIIFNGKIDNDK